MAYCATLLAPLFESDTVAAFGNPQKYFTSHGHRGRPMDPIGGYALAIPSNIVGRTNKFQFGQLLASAYFSANPIKLISRMESGGASLSAVQYGPRGQEIFATKYRCGMTWEIWGFDRLGQEPPGPENSGNHRLAGRKEMQRTLLLGANRVSIDKCSEPRGCTSYAKKTDIMTRARRTSIRGF